MLLKKGKLAKEGYGLALKIAEIFQIKVKNLHCLTFHGKIHILKNEIWQLFQPENVTCQNFKFWSFLSSQTATETGESSIVTDDINSNDVTSHDYLTTSSSITPVKLQTVTFSSPEGTTSEDTVLIQSASTGRTTGGGGTGPGPSVTHQTIEGK